MGQIELFKMRKYGLGDPFKSNEDAPRERNQCLFFRMLIINQHFRKQTGSFLACIKFNDVNSAKKSFI